MSQKNELIDSVMAFFKNPDQTFYRLQGSAGRGKSTSIIAIIEAFIAIRKVQSLFDPEKKIVTSSNLFVTATTNQALEVLAQGVEDLEKKHNIDIYRRTIHSFLGLRMYNDYENGGQKLGTNKHADPLIIKPDSLLIIDEASYAQRRIWQDVNRVAAVKKGFKVIVVADKRQGKVIKEGLSNFIARIPESFELSVSYRFPEDSAINLNSKMLEKVIDGTAEPEPFLEDDTFKIITRKEAMQLFKAKAIEADEDIKYVAYYNATINKFNKQVQLRKYGDTRFHAGQHLISPDSQLIGDNAIANNSKHIIKNVLGNSVVSHQDKQGNEASIETYQVQLTKYGNSVFNVPRDLSQYYKLLKHLAKEKQWQLFFACKESVLELRQAWAITCFKSQGSTYDYTIVDMAELEAIPSPDDFFRMLNVAITRSRKCTYLIMED